MKVQMAMIWEEPPAPGNGPPGGVVYADRKHWVGELRKNPGKWARWNYPTRDSTQLAAELRKAYWPELEVVNRLGGVWAKWNPAVTP